LRIIVTAHGIKPAYRNPDGSRSRLQNKYKDNKNLWIKKLLTISRISFTIESTTVPGFLSCAALSECYRTAILYGDVCGPGWCGVRKRSDGIVF